MRRTIVASIVSILTAATAPVTSAEGSPVAVAIIVNSANTVDSLSVKQLKQIFSGEKPRWTDGEKLPIQTLATGAASPEHEAAIRFLFGMNEVEYRKYTMHASFVGTPQQVPRDAGSSQAILSAVAATRGAIGFVRADLINDKVRVVKIDGLGPGDPGYAMAGEK